MSIEALVFDVDGTLADTEEVHRESFNRAFERRGLGWRWSADEYKLLLDVTGGKERMLAYIEQQSAGDAEKKHWRELVPELHADKTAIYTEIVRDGGMPLRSGVARLLDEAREAGLRLAIATTTSAINVDALLQVALGTQGLAMFDVIACGDQVRRKKPAPDVYELVLDTLGVSADRAIAFEDSANGLRSAMAAGLWTVITPTFWTADADFAGAGLVLPGLGDAHAPISGEPGGRLRHAAWLGIDELMEMAPPSRPSGLTPLYAAS